jgi:hypothetical protein
MRRVREEVVSLLQEHAAALDGNGWIVFHPRLSTSDRTRLRQLLDTWWRKLAEQSWSVEAMSSSSTLDLAYLDDEEEREQLAIQIMNLMIAVAETGKGDIRMAKVFGPLLMRQRRLGEGPGGSALPEIFAGLLGLSMGVLERMASRAARLLCEPMVQ